MQMQNVHNVLMHLNSIQLQEQEQEQEREQEQQQQQGGPLEEQQQQQHVAHLNQASSLYNCICKVLCGGPQAQNLLPTSCQAQYSCCMDENKRTILPRENGHHLQVCCLLVTAPPDALVTD